MASILLPCPSCKKRISSSAHSCPHCGEPLSDKWENQARKSHERKQAGWGFLVLLILGFVAFGIYRSPDKASVSAGTQAKVVLPPIPTAKIDPAMPPLAQPVPPGPGEASNIVKSRGAVVCTSLTSAQIVFQLSQAKQLDKSPHLEGCWHIPKGKEVMVLSIAGGYAFVSPMDDLRDRAWTSVQWLDAN